MAATVFFYIINEKRYSTGLQNWGILGMSKFLVLLWDIHHKDDDVNFCLNLFLVCLFM